MNEIILRRTYCDILQGYSLDTKSGLFIRHLNNLNQSEFDYIYHQEYEKLKKEGIPTEDELLILLDEIGEWTKEDEKELVEIDDYLAQLYTTKKKFFRDVDKREAQKEIDEWEKKRAKKSQIKTNLLSQTCEKYASNKQYTAYVTGSIYEDDKLTKRKFSQKDVDMMSDDELDFYTKIYSDTLEFVSGEKIKKLALSQMFQQAFRLCNGVYEFFGIPAAHLTFYQTILGTYGNVFKKILEENDIPDKIIEDPDLVLDFVNANKEVQNKMANKPRNTNLVGVSSEEYEKLGLAKPKTVVEEFSSRDGKLTKQEIIKLKTAGLG